jgi:hypothetical protein
VLHMSRSLLHMTQYLKAENIYVSSTKLLDTGQVTYLL